MVQIEKKSVFSWIESLNVSVLCLNDYDRKISEKSVILYSYYSIFKVTSIYFGSLFLEKSVKNPWKKKIKEKFLTDLKFLRI